MGVVGVLPITPARCLITKRLYIPGIGWERIVRMAGAAQIEAALSLRLSLEDDPALVPLETLPGEDHYVRSGRGSALALDDRLTTERSPLRLELRCAIAALHGKQRFVLGSPDSHCQDERSSAGSGRRDHRRRGVACARSTVEHPVIP